MSLEQENSKSFKILRSQRIETEEKETENPFGLSVFDTDRPRIRGERVLVAVLGVLDLLFWKRGRG